MGDILANLNVSTAVLAIIAAGLLIASVGFALWAVDVFATFYDDADDPERSLDDHYNAQFDADIASGVEVECPECGYPMSPDMAIHAVHNGYCPKCGGDI